MFETLKPLTYQVIMADPPWSFDNYSRKGEAKNAKRQYACMPTEEICAMPVNQLAGGDCVLWLWATHPMLAPALSVLGAWGFSFATSGVWVKRTKHGKLAFGTGYCLRCASEPFLIGTVGSPQFAKNVRTVLEGPVREHSRKPDEAYAVAERLVPRALHRADLFSRQVRPGWTAWGNETQKFEAV